MGSREDHVIVDDIEEEQTHKATIASSLGIEDAIGRLITYQDHNVQYYIANESGQIQQHVMVDNNGNMQVDQMDKASALICLICEGQANGIHFGAMSCAACNAFFRRSVAENRKYVCRKDGNCVINYEVRCFCRSCRMKKCLEMGMDPKAVQPHRDAIGKKPPTKNPKVITPTVKPLNELERKPISISPKPYSFGTQTAARASVEMPNTNIVVRSTSHSVSPPLMSQTQPMNTTFARAPQVVTDADGNRFLLYEYTMEEEMAENMLNQDYSHEVSDFPMETSEPSKIDLETPSKSPPKPKLTKLTPVKLNRSVIPEHYTPKETPSNSFLGKELLDDENILKTSLAAYKSLRERRRLHYCPRTLRAIFGNVEPEFNLVHGGSYFQKDRCVTEAALIAEYINSIKPFSMLSLDDKVALVKSFGPRFAIIEKYYITYQHRGHETNRIYHQDYTYYDISDEKAFLSGSTNPEDPKHEKGSPSSKSKPSPMVGPATMRELNLPYMRKALKNIVGSMVAVGMSDVEFVALILTLLFDPAIQGVSEIARRVISSARNRVYEEWMAHYVHTNVPNGAEKVGNTVLILSELQELTNMGSQNFHMVRLFGITDYDELLNDLYM